MKWPLTSVPLPARAAGRQTRAVITNVIIHLINELPVMADLEALPGPADRSVRCTNVRTVDGKQPTFVHDVHGTFVFPLGVIRLIEAPSAAAEAKAPPPLALVSVEQTPPPLDEEPDEDLLARIRSV